MKMKPLKALKGYIRDLANLQLHILLTEEDNVIVARCLDFSVSSHGDNEEDALASLSDSIKNYLTYAISQGAINEIIDPEEEMLWEIYKNLELQKESLIIKDLADSLKKNMLKEVTYAESS